MTTRQLGAFLGTSNAAVIRLEQRENDGKVTLEALNRAAQAMGCRLIYAIVPDETLETIVDNKAQDAARALLRSVSHTMKLEQQEVGAQATERQLHELARELKAKLDPSLWEKRS